MTARPDGPRWSRRIAARAAAFAISLCLLSAAAFAAASEGDAPLRTVAEIRAQPSHAFYVDRSLELEGIVTLVDAQRNMLVLQDATGAIALHPDAVAKTSLRPGQRVRLKAASAIPYTFSFPDYPDRPSATDILSSFEAPADQVDFRLTRMRGWLRPPASGEYTCFISSDDSSQLWLSKNASPVDAQKIAEVKTAEWTAPREWTRFPHQRSQPVHLEAGKRYYIEALHEQHTDATHLAVAWEGPGLKRQVIDGRYLIPREAAGAPAEAGAGRGIARQVWDDYFAASLEPVSVGVTEEGGLAIRGLQVEVLEVGVWPEPRKAEFGVRLQPGELYLWMEGEGTVNFSASDGNAASFELISGTNTATVRVASWEGPLPPIVPRTRMQFRGVCEGGRDFFAQPIAAVFAAPSESEVALSPQEVGPGDPTLPAEPLPVGPPGGGYYYSRAVVTFNDRVNGQPLLYVQEAARGVYVSQEERKLDPPLQVGQSIDIGGPMVKRAYGLGIRPVSMRILGWHALPPPAGVGTLEPENDGRWSEVEGVVRLAYPDGTILVQGSAAPCRAWIGKSDLEANKKLVNSVLRLRGVLSFSAFEFPALLVPSLGNVEVVDPAPPSPPPLASLPWALEQKGPWQRLVRTVGAVTYSGKGGLYLQDKNGAVFVEGNDLAALPVGSVVEVIGFPEDAGRGKTFVESTVHPVQGDVSVSPIALEGLAGASAQQGKLVTVDARLLSQKTQEDVQVYMFQAGETVFDAVLPSPGAPEIAPGSLVAVTGVLNALPALSGGTGSAGGGVNLLLRSPADLLVLHGPQWLTWKRAALPIGVVLVIAAASLLRLEYMRRKFQRQQEERETFAREMLKGQESERRRIAASLHDSLGQNLLVIRSQALRALQAPEDRQGLERRRKDISSTTMQAINEVREITHDLRPHQLDRLGLTQAVRALARKVSDSGSVSLASHVDEIDGIFPNETEIHIYRIVQEAINNIMKHAEATEAAVVIKKKPGAVSISVRDNGKGLQPAAPRSSGFGLHGIRDRAALIGGTSEVISAPGQGLSVHVEIPAPSQKL